MWEEKVKEGARRREWAPACGKKFECELQNLKWSNNKACRVSDENVIWEDERDGPRGEWLNGQRTKGGRTREMRSTRSEAAGGTCVRVRANKCKRAFYNSNLNIVPIVFASIFFFNFVLLSKNSSIFLLTSSTNRSTKALWAWNEMRFRKKGKTTKLDREIKVQNVYGHTHIHETKVRNKNKRK